MTDAKTLYEEDTAARSEQQAAALRAAGRGGSNQLLDWEHLAEEIKSLSKPLRLGLRSQISRILQHHVKLQHSPAEDPPDAWRRSIHQARAEIDPILDDSPSLRRAVPALIEKKTPRAVELATIGRQARDEISRLQLPSLRRARYTEEQVLGDWFPPSRGNSRAARWEIGGRQAARATLC